MALQAHKDSALKPAYTELQAVSFPVVGRYA